MPQTTRKKKTIMKNLLDALRDVVVGMIILLPFVVCAAIMALLFKYYPITLWIFVFICLISAFIEIGRPRQ
jgi:uncharacterized membrane protein